MFVVGVVGVVGVVLGLASRPAIERGLAEGGTERAEGLLRRQWPDPSRSARRLLEGGRRTAQVGIPPYPDAVRVRVQGVRLDRIPRARGLGGYGYGAALPEAPQAPALTLTFVDADGRKTRLHADHRARGLSWPAAAESA